MICICVQSTLTNRLLFLVRRRHLYKLQPGTERSLFRTNIVCRSVRRVLFRFHEVTLGLGLGHDQDFFGFRSDDQPKRQR